MILEHLPALQVILPLIAAPACLLLRQKNGCWVLAVAVSWLSFAIAVLLLLSVLQSGTINYALGGWDAPWGIEYRIDMLAAYMLLFITAVNAVVIISARTSLEQEIDTQQMHLYYAGWILCLAGLLGIIVTGDIFNVFVFLEISSLSSYLLISAGRDRRALTASFQYLILGTIGATFLLIGIGLLYMMTGTLNIVDLSHRLPALIDNRAIQAGFFFIIIGLLIKAAVFPLHFWLPNAYQYAPTVVSAFLAATATKVALYLLIRISLSLFGHEISFDVFHLDRLLLPMAVISIFIMSLVAIYQTDIKRLLAFSSVAQIGYIILGIGLASEAGYIASLVHLFNHALIKGALFLAVGAMIYRIGSSQINQFAGIGHRMPWTFGAFVIVGLSLIGIPFTAGFISKWTLLTAIFERGSIMLAIAVIVTSLMALVYIWKIIEIAWLQKPADTTRCEAPVSMVLPLWILALANVYFGLDTRLPVGLSKLAISSVIGVAP